MPSPSSSQTSRTCRRCSCTSSQVWCTVSSGAPLNSNCPPGSSVIEHRASFASAITLPFSSTGSQPKRVIALQQRADAVRPLIGHARQIGAAENEFFVLGADAPRARRLAAAFVIFDQLPLVGDRRSLQARRPRHAAPETPDSDNTGRRISAVRTRPPVAGDRLINRQRGKGGGLGAQYPRAEPDARNNGEFAESVKLRFGEPAFRADKHRRRRRPVGPARAPRRSAGRRRSRRTGSGAGRRASRRAAA